LSADDSLRIAYVSHVFWPEMRRGGERMIRDLADGLVARGHRPRLVTSHHGLPSRRTEDGLDVVRQWRPPERPLLRLGLPPGMSHAPGALFNLRRHRDDVVHAFTAAAALAAANSGRPSVFVFQGMLHPDDWRGRPRTYPLLLRAARGCDVVTTYSEVAAQAFTEHTGIEARSINPGIRLDAFTPGGERAERPTIFCAADPTEARKRVGLLVDAFAQLRQRVPDAELLLQKGSDPLSRADLDLGPGVRFVDPGADRDALVGLYREAWVTVLPSFREAFGLVAVESLACGTPVVGATDGGAVPLILGTDERIGRVAAPEPDALAGAILDALELAGAPVTKAVCRTRAEHFRVDACVDAYVSLYRELSAS
jgi:glycosyltransferase involved in cell wall biosynthesis